MAALDALVAVGAVSQRDRLLSITPDGVRRLTTLYSEIEAALDPSPTTASMMECPTVPWLTQVETHWIDAVSLNYAVEPTALARLLPAPLEPELHKGTAWVQLLMSSLRDMRPQGLFSLFGVCFYQISYRAAVRYRAAGGSMKRGGFFVRSDTNHPVMRKVGNLLTEFRFHEFGAAEMTMLRKDDQLTLGVDPDAASPGGRVFAQIDTRPLAGAPAGSLWRSVEDLHEPLVECYDALGVDANAGFLYVLTIDRDPWNPWFVAPTQVYSEFFEDGALRGAARLDSVLHFRECGYRWRPLRREPLGSRLAPGGR
jgi:uncharacterized protein YqjF (DUF2071 family)